MIPRHASRCHHGPFNSLPMMDLSTLCPQWPARPKTVPDFFGIIVGKPKRRLIERKNKVDGNCIQDHSPPDQRTDIRTNLTSSSIGRRRGCNAIYSHQVQLHTENACPTTCRSNPRQLQVTSSGTPSGGDWKNNSHSYAIVHRLQDFGMPLTFNLFWLLKRAKVCLFNLA
ncbi:hypothetical protein AVEN_182988-1 [Araneus ventricosus]|uniref:Uncharacterized protein n=1 Tax=Araneus ventricosus TaxID=182803 RepID=A0A4Y2RN15_ARAVE|nr:hypothetical protein AVEN_182988-1 [Araneus ventricosus]